MISIIIILLILFEFLIEKGLPLTKYSRKITTIIQIWVSKPRTAVFGIVGNLRGFTIWVLVEANL